MDIKLTIDFPALDRFVDALASQAGIAAPSAEGKVPTTKKDAKTTAPASSSGASQTKGTSTAATAAGNAVDVDVATEDVVDLAEGAKLAAKKLSEANGRDALVEALKEHGASAGVSSIPDDKKADFIAFCDAAVG